MNKETKIGLAALLVAVVALGVGFFRGGETVTNTQTERIIREIVGAMPGNELQGPEFIVGGVKTLSKRIDMIASTNTPCALQNTFGTSTIELVSMTQNVSNTASVIWTVATGTARTATGTPASAIGAFTIAASQKVAHAVGGTGYTNTGSSTQRLVIRANEWVNVNISGTPGLTTSSGIGGNCNFILQEL